MTEKSHHAIVYSSGLVELKSGFLFRIQWLFSPEHAIMDDIHRWNESGKHFVWTKSSKEILRSVRKATRD